MKKITLEKGQVKNYYGVYFSIVDANMVNDNGYKAIKYLVKLEKGSKIEYIEFTDSNHNYENNIPMSLNDFIYNIIGDYQIVTSLETIAIDNIANYLIDDLGFTDYRQITKISKELLRQYNIINSMFSNDDIEKLVELYNEY